MMQVPNPAMIRSAARALWALHASTPLPELLSNGIGGFIGDAAKRHITMSRHGLWNTIRPESQAAGDLKALAMLMAEHLDAEEEKRFWLDATSDFILHKGDATLEHTNADTKQE